MFFLLGKRTSVPLQQRRVFSSTSWACWAAAPKQNALALIHKNPNRYQITTISTWLLLKIWPIYKLSPKLMLQSPLKCFFSDCRRCKWSLRPGLRSKTFESSANRSKSGFRFEILYEEWVGILETVLGHYGQLVIQVTRGLGEFGICDTFIIRQFI